MRRFLIGIFMLALIGTSFGAYPNWHFKDSTFPYWRIESGEWKFQTGATPPTSDLILQYLMGANGSESTITLDTSGNNYTGTVSGATWNQATNGITDYYEGNGSSTRITSAWDGTASGDAMTISYWVNYDVLGSTDCAFVIRNGSSQYIAPLVHSTTADIRWYNAWSGDSMTLDAVGVNVVGKWRNYVFVIDQDANPNFLIYVDGSLVNSVYSAGFVGNGFAWANAVILMDDTDGVGREIDGKFTKCEVLTNALTAAEVLATNRTQAVELGILSEYLQANYPNTILLDWEASDLLTEGSTNSWGITTPSAFTMLGDLTNGWGNGNGSANYSQLNDPLATGTNDFTIISQTRIEASGGKNRAFSNKHTTEDGIQLTVRWSDGNIYFIVDSGTQYLLSASAPSINNWHQIVGLRRGSALELYVDSVLVDSDTMSGSVDPSNNASIGGEPGASSPGYLDGDIDQIAILLEGLSPTAVTNLYNATKL